MDPATATVFELIEVFASGSPERSAQACIDGHSATAGQSTSSAVTVRRRALAAETLARQWATSAEARSTVSTSSRSESRSANRRDLHALLGGEHSGGGQFSDHCFFVDDVAADCEFGVDSDDDWTDRVQQRLRRRPDRPCSMSRADIEGVAL